MIIQKAYKTELKPNNKQKTLMVKNAGASRFAYNWGLDRKEAIYLFNQLPVPHIKYPTAIDLHKELTQLKKTELSWMYEVSKCSPQEALRDLDEAYTNFFQHRAEHPKYKSKKNGIGSFRLNNHPIHIFENNIQLPKIGKIRLKERNYLPQNAHILSATVSEKLGRWYVSVLMEEDIQIPINNGKTIGIDLCANDKMAHCSDNTIFRNPRAYRTLERKKKRFQREVSRKKLGSNNRRKARRKLGKLENRVANARKDAQHKLTTMLTKTKSVIGIEDLNVSGMTKNHNIAKSIIDVGMGEIRRQLEYKARWYGSNVIIIDRFYPSSKTCSHCGNINQELKLSDRIFNCPVCNFLIDRDLNASINLERFAISSMENLNDCLRQEIHAITHIAQQQVIANDSVNEYQVGDVLNG